MRCRPSAKRSMFGSREWARDVRWDSRAAGVVNVKDDEGACGVDCVVGWSGGWRDASSEACAGSRREVSMSERVGIEVVSEGAGGGGMVVVVAARASQDAFSCSSLTFISIDSSLYRD